MRRGGSTAPRFAWARALLAAGLLVSAACAPATQSATTDPTPVSVADSVAIRQTLATWYTAMQATDSAGILAPLTPQFLLLEDTLPLTGLQLVTRLKKAGATGPTWRATFSGFTTRLHGDVAWTTVHNHEDVMPAPGGKPCAGDFLETIVFVRTNGRWLIDRYHAAVLHPFTCS
jgi:ketosteroid isomerase-like protein